MKKKKDKSWEGSLASQSITVLVHLHIAYAADEEGIIRQQEKRWDENNQQINILPLQPREKLISFLLLFKCGRMRPGDYSL